MKNAVYHFFLIAFVPFFLAACDRNENEVTGKVELYLLDSCETIDQSCAIDESSVVTRATPLIAYADIKSYNSNDYVFNISNDAREAIGTLELPVTGLPFAITADKELIYTGYFWPAYSSLMCQWITIDPILMSGGNELHLELGYPGSIEGVAIPDERNNKKILDIFRRDGKLID